MELDGKKESEMIENLLKLDLTKREDYEVMTDFFLYMSMGMVLTTMQREKPIKVIDAAKGMVSMIVILSAKAKMMEEFDAKKELQEVINE